MKRPLPYTIFLLTALLLMPLAVCAQTFDYQTIMKFAQYVYWPENQQNDTFYIYIAAKDPAPLDIIEQSINSQATFHNRPIAVKHYNDNTDISLANIFFIDNSAEISNNILEEKLKKKQILTLSNNKNLLNYGCMFFIEQKETYIDYLFKKQAIIDSGLTIRTSLLHITHQYQE